MVGIVFVNAAGINVKGAIKMVDVDGNGNKVYYCEKC